MKKILIIDDSALMRRVLRDIISSDSRFQVSDVAIDGEEGLRLLTSNQYDGVVLDVNMPKMTGIELLKELRHRKIKARIMMASTETRDGAALTLEALELGAIDFIHKPDNIVDARDKRFQEKFIKILSAVTDSKLADFSPMKPIAPAVNEKFLELVSAHADSRTKVVALACSTGGPRALQYVIPRLPANLKAPVLIVQHMPAKFTKSLADRMNELSDIAVKEAEEGDILEAGKVYIARGGQHMNVLSSRQGHTIHYTDEPSREGVKPCANYMYESLEDSRFEKVICVVLTGMGADGTEGIQNLIRKKDVHIIAQNEKTCAVFGMPKSIIQTGIPTQVVAIEQIAQEIIMNVGVQ